MLAIEEVHLCGGQRIYIRITQVSPDLWRGEIATQEPILYDYFQTPRDAAPYLHGLLREAFPDHQTIS